MVGSAGCHAGIPFGCGHLVWITCWRCGLHPINHDSRENKQTVMIAILALFLDRLRPCAPACVMALIRGL